MDLRDYFAGQAIAGMLSNPHCTLPCTQRDSFPEHTLQILAFHAYQIADSMLQASELKERRRPSDALCAGPAQSADATISHDESAF
jgi:hypothetical protein